MEQNTLWQNREIEIGLPKIWQTKTPHSRKYHSQFFIVKLTPEEEHTLSFSLDDHIRTKQNDIKIKTEFESFYYQILKHTNQLDQRRQDELKSKIRRTCENYSQIKVPCKYQK